MPETSREIFADMKERITFVLASDWASYISTVTSAYASAFNRVTKLLDRVKAAETARREKEQALMVTTLSILTGGVVGVLADGFVQRLPKLEKSAMAMEGGLMKATQVAAADPVLYKIFKDTTKDLVKRGAGAVTQFGLDQFKGSPPSSGFDPVGMEVDDYRDLLTQGIIDRAKFLHDLVEVMYEQADGWSSEAAGAMRKGMYENNDFFRENPYRAARHLLERKAELALWSGWVLNRDDDYWLGQRAATQASLSTTESLSWAPVRDELCDLDVPEDSITVVGYQAQQSALIRGSWKGVPKGFDVLGFKDWVQSHGFTETLYEGIPIAGGAVRHFATTRMHQTDRILAAAA